MNTQYLIECKLKKGYNSTTLARELGIDNSAITYWEQGKKYPRVNTLIKLCRVLDMDANILLNIK